MAITAEYTTAPLRVAPSAAAGVAVTPAATGWTNSSYVEITAATSEAWVLAGVVIDSAAAGEYEIDIATGAAASETVICTVPGNVATTAIGGFQWIPLPIPIDNIASGARVSVRMRKVGTDVTPWGFKIAYYKQSEFGANATKTTKAMKCLPSAAAGVLVTPNATGWANSSFVEITSSMPANAVLVGVMVDLGAAQPREIDIATGAAGSEVAITTFRHIADSNAGALFLLPHNPPFDGISSGSRVSVRIRKNGTSVSQERYKIAYYEKPL